MQQTKIMNRLSGFDRHFRGRFLLLHRKLLSDQEYILWDLSYSCLADWDKSHGEVYGSFEYALWEIGWLIGWSPSKVSRNAGKLYSLGFWRKQGKRVYVVDFDIREKLTEIVKEKKIVDLQEHIADLQGVVAEAQQPHSDLQQKVSKENDDNSPQSVAKMQRADYKPLSSFKCGCNLRNGHRSNEEYREMLEKDANNLDIKTMQEIDESLWESTGVCPHGEELYANNKT